MSERTLMLRLMYSHPDGHADRKLVGHVAVFRRVGGSSFVASCDWPTRYELSPFELIEWSCALMDAANLLQANERRS